MKTKTYILFAMAALLTISCSEENIAETYSKTGQEAYGNQNLKATNPKTIAQVLSLYNAGIYGDPVQVTEPTQIQGVVIGNDEGGNIYNQLYIQDTSGTICISIGQGGLYGAYPIGQSILLELNDLYIGNYGGQPQVGIYGVNQKSGAVQLSKMSRYQWLTHHKIIEAIKDVKAEPIEITTSTSLTYPGNCNQLVTLKGVELTEANGIKAFANAEDAPTGQYAVNRSIKGTSKMVLRTSTSAKFAMSVMPQGKVNITGILSYYYGTWQIMMRTLDDIQTAQ